MEQGLKNGDGKSAGKPVAVEGNLGLGVVRLKMAQDFCESAWSARKRIRARYHANMRRLADRDPDEWDEQAARHARSMIQGPLIQRTCPQ